MSGISTSCGTVGLGQARYSKSQSTVGMGSAAVLRLVSFNTYLVAAAVSGKETRQHSRAKGIGEWLSQSSDLAFLQVMLLGLRGKQAFLTQLGRLGAAKN